MAVLAHGAVVKLGDGATPEVFTAISGPMDITFNPGDTEKVDVTNHDSTAREYLQGLAGDGECSYEVQYDTSVTIHKTLRDKHDVSTASNIQVLFNDGTLADFAATTSVSFDLGVASKAQIMQVKHAISGGVSYTDP